MHASIDHLDESFTILIIIIIVVVFFCFSFFFALSLSLVRSLIFVVAECRSIDLYRSIVAATVLWLTFFSVFVTVGDFALMPGGT